MKIKRILKAPINFIVKQINKDLDFKQRSGSVQSAYSMNEMMEKRKYEEMMSKLRKK